MFYAELTKDSIRFRAFETEREAAQWIVDQLGDGYAEDFWVGKSGQLCTSGKMFDFGAKIFDSLSDAIRAQADLDPEAARAVLRSLCDAITDE